MTDPFERTAPRRSRWDQEGAEFVASDREWIERFCARLRALEPALDEPGAQEVGQSLSDDAALRALSPEAVAEQLHELDLSLDDSGLGDIPR